MFSAGDSSGQLANFGLSNGMNLNLNTTDWAQLAQQWIQMRDLSGVGGEVPVALSPPRICGNFQAPAINPSKHKFEEKGESDMEIDENEQDELKRERQEDESPAPAPPMWFLPTEERTEYTNQQSVPVLPTAGQWNVWPPRIPPPNVHIPSLLKINVPNPNSTPMGMNTTTDDTVGTSTTIDAAKRKILPAWIREGLEKMEREKQRQQTEKKHPQRLDVDITEGAANLKTSNAHMVKTKFLKTSDSDSSGNEGAEKKQKAPLEAANNKHNIDGCVAASQSSHIPQTFTDTSVWQTSSSNVDSSQQIGKSYEHKLADLMVEVRRVLTELLLEVTNTEINSIVLEAIKARKCKASSAQVVPKSALSSITSKLGLSAYADSDSEESNASEVDAPSDTSANENSDESLEVIKEAIRTKRQTFAKLTEDIEDRIAANAAREEQKLKYYTLVEQQRQEQQNQCTSDYSAAVYKSLVAPSSPAAIGGKVFDKDFGETTESNFQHSNGKTDRTARKERTTRFSDNKDSRSNSVATNVTFISQLQQCANPATISLLTSDTGSTSLYSGSTACIASKPAVDKSAKSKSSSTSSSKSSSTTYSDTSSSYSSRNSSKYSRGSFSSRKRRSDVHSQSKRRRHKNSSTHSSYGKSDYEYRHSHRYQRKYTSDSDDNRHRSRHSTTRRDKYKRKSRSRSRSRSSYTSNSRHRH